MAMNGHEERESELLDLQACLCTKLMDNNRNMAIGKQWDVAGWLAGLAGWLAGWLAGMV